MADAIDWLWDLVLALALALVALALLALLLAVTTGLLQMLTRRGRRR